MDSVNVKDYKLDELRDLIGYVPQKNVLFTGDIASNLNFGNENGTDTDWQEAARIACADKFVEKSPLAESWFSVGFRRSRRTIIVR